ncbi:hypothetical protein ACFYNO_14130 [Kitasatospora sp. NPDC006697]|uniref:hypothetical protein n=1 Tax=Kitasatospora sp. NPDC006697 TaxID=3364020 RepID=UPI0036C54CC7
MPDPFLSFVSQLNTTTHQFDVRPGPVPAVLLLSRSCDHDLDAVQARLAATGVPFLRLNADELAGADLLIAPDHRTVRLNGRQLTPTVSWLRHFSPSAIDTAEDPAQRLFLRDSWQAATAQFAAVSRTSLTPARPDLLTQLRLARRHGAAVPRTLLTTTPTRAGEHFRSPRLVIKSADRHFVEPVPGRLHGIFPTVLDRADLARQPPGPPVLVQEYVEHSAELRVYHVAGALHAFEVAKASPAAPWLTPDRLDVRPVPTPPAVAAATTALAAALGLRYAAFDFLLTPDGPPVFLELNPDGDWHWAERHTGTTEVTEAVAAMLTALHRAAQPPAGRFDLLGFLVDGP